MFRLPKSLPGRMLRKASAFLLAYCFFATSLWLVALPVDGRPVGRPAQWVYSLAEAGLASANHAAGNAAAHAYPSVSSYQASKSPAFTHYAELRAANPAVTKLAAATAVAAMQGGGGTTTINFFGPEQYVRTTGDPNTYTTTVQVPAWVANPFNLHIQNGEANGSNRVSSATITVNNVQVAVPSDFNQNVFTIDRAVTLTPTTTLVVTLASKPGSYLRINLAGANGDHTPPVLTIAAPLTNSAINTPQAHLDIKYQDLPGPGEPAASGVDTTTLQVLLDGTDRTSLFTKFSNEATADVPASLALIQGQHTLTASIKDFAGNTAQATSQFQVDTTPPTIQILQPAAGSYINNAKPLIQIAYSDNFGINTASLKVTINGADQSAQFAKTATGASASITLPQGANSITAGVSDQAGNQSSASTSFNVDTTPPTVTILHPLAASVHGSSAVEFSVQFSDDQALDLSSAQVSIDGASVAFTMSGNSASGSATLADGNHNLSATVKDKAGNQGSASTPFSVDTTAPDIHIVQPANGAILNNPSPTVLIQIGSSLDLDSSTFQVTIDGTDETAQFPLNGLTASGNALHLADGSHTIHAQVAKVTGKVGQAQNGLVIDTISPEVTIDPIGFTNNATPTAVVRYSDSGSGVKLSTLHVLVDGADITSTFSVGAFSAQGVLAAGTGLAEGQHSIQATIADNAGNVSSSASANFTVDLTPPTATFTSPANDSFINTTQPTITLTYSDSGSGVDPNSVRIFLQPLNQPETEITSLFTGSAGQATAVISSSSALTAGTYHLRAQVGDRAGNQAAPASTFAIDLTPPTYNIVSPAANVFLNTATPNFVVTYQDDSSGVDPTKFVLQVDGVDRTNRLTVTQTGASGALLPADALTDGTHTVSVNVFDRAGNEAPVVPQSFLVDTIPPALSIATPVSGGYTNVALTPITVSYSDSGSGVDVTTFKLLIDGVDQTAQFTVTATGATGVPAAVLPDGLHTISASIKDLAGNPSTATATFSVDTIPPQITITQPANGLFTNAASLVVAGSVVDAAPVTVTVEGTAVAVQNGTFTSAGITLGTNATQLIHIVATDAAGNSSTVTLTINIDRTPPTITGAINPPPNAAGWNSTAVTVTFTCADSGSGVATCPAPVPVTVEGANQAITGTAVDKAGNTAQATVTVNIDETPPVITATPAPAPNAAGWNTTDVTITYVCSDNLSGVVACPPQKTVSTEGKAQQINATVSDQAGNTAAAPVLLNIEKTAPAIAASVAPPPNAAGWNNTNVTVNFSCTPSASDIVSCQTPINVSTEGKAQSVTGTVTDQAGKSNTAIATVNIDKTPPSISASVAPPPNAAGWNNTNVIVSYLCSDSLSGIAICPSPATVSAEGAAENVSAQAVDVAGNTSAVTTTLNIDKTPPVVTASATPSPNGAGWNNGNVTVTFSCTDSLSGVASCPPQQLVASEGQNQNIVGQATDVAGNTGVGGITLSIDKTPPTIVQLSTPDHISRLHGGQVSVTANDNFFVTQVTISVNGTSLGTFTSAPYQAPLVVPVGANPGDTLTVTALATDEAGNTQSASRAVRVAADGVIVGQVLSDATSFPIQNASVHAISTTAASDQTDDHGRYSLQASDSHLFLSVSSAAPATTTVEREIFVQEGVGTVPVDARLTPLAAPVAIGSVGGTLAAGNITVTVPAGAVGDGTTFQLTPLSGQGLPGLLPLGWTPLAAFDFRASSSAINLPAAIAQLPNTIVHFVTYNPALHAWTMVAANLQANNGTVSVALPSSGSYALVVPDVVTPSIPIPAVGSPVTGIAMQVLDPAASSSGSLSPAILPPSGGTSIATLGVQTASAVPSGTVIQANILETFSLASGDKVSEETRSEDIVIYNALAAANSTLGAQFPVSPSQKYTNKQLLTGKVHLDILAGREGVRGQPGGSNPVTLTDGTSTLSVPGGALGQDTAINVQSVALENFVPTNGTLGALQEVLVDFSGETLNTPAQLSISSTGLNPADTYFLTQVQRIDGIPHIVLIALAQINGATLTSVATPGLPGITQGGEYVFYDVSAPVGYVQGVASSSAGPVQALVQTDSLPIVSITGANGQFIVPALAGTANLKATSPHTNLAGSATVQVTAGQTAQTNIQLTGTVTSSVVSPADGTLGVPASTTIIITTTAPLNPQAIVQANLVLLQGTASSGTPVPIQPFVLSSSGTVLSFAPVNNLQPATQYTIQVSGLADAFGGAVVVPVSSFTTQAVAPLNFNPNAITFSFPDQNGNVQVNAPAGSLPPGTKVLIVDQSSALVLSLTALNDGSVSGNFPATINDTLAVTVTDPNGATASFTRSQFVAPDGTTAVGSGGGTVTGPGNTGLIIPKDALTKAATFKLTPLDQTAFPQLPTWPGLSFGSGLHVDAPDMPVFNQEVKLAFPVPPNAPKNAFYYVYRRVRDQDGKTYFETIDHAFVQGTGANAQVVTASPPFCGYHNPIGNFNIAVAASSGSFAGGSIFTPVTTPFQDFFLMFDIAQIDPNQPGIASPGLIVGLVQQTVPAVVGQSAQTTQPYIANVKVSLDSDPSQIATYDPKCSTFSIFDPKLGGGTRTITVTGPATLPDGSTQNQTVLHATVDEVNGVQVDDATFGIFAGLENQYRNIGRVTLTFLPSTPAPPPPQLSIRLFTLDGNGHRVPATGIMQTGANIVIAFQSKLSVQGASISGTQLPVSSPDTAPEVTDNQPERLLLDTRVNGTFPLGAAGTYTIEATALDPVSLTRTTASQTILVVASGGAGNTQTKTCNASSPPAALTASCSLAQIVSVLPLADATAVSPGVFPEIAFDQPVTNVSGQVILSDHTGSVVPVRLVGVRAPNSPNSGQPIADPVQPADVVTSLTIQPLDGLKYNETYTLTLNANSTAKCADSTDPNHLIPIPQPSGNPYIVDGNQPPTGPLCLQEFPKPGTQPYKFTTFGPQEIGGTTDQFASTRPVIIGNRAFLGERIGVSLAGLASVDITDPTHPVDKGIGSGATFVGLATDVAGQAISPVTNGPLVAVSAGQPGIENVIPSNVWIYDVTAPDAPVRVAAVSATTSTTQDGQVLHIFMKDQFLYTATFPKGLQVIDLQAAVAEYQSVFSSNPTQFGQAITTEGNGFAMDTVVNTIPLFAGNYQPAPLPSPIPPPPPPPPYAAIVNDVKAADYVTAPPPTGSADGTPGTTQTFIVATGRLPLVIADPQQPGPNAVLYPAFDGGSVPSPNPGAGLPSLDPSPLSLQVNNPDGSTSTYTMLRGQAVALGTLSTTDAQGNSNSEQVAVIVGSGNAPLPDGTSSPSALLMVVNIVTNPGDPSHPIKPVVQGAVALPTFGTDVVIHGNLALVGTTANKILLVSLVDPTHPVSAGEIDAPTGGILGDRIAVTDDGLIATSSFNFTAGGLHLSALGTFPLIAVSPDSLMADLNKKSSSDLKINYAITGDLTHVQSANLQIQDDKGQVVYTAPVPVQPTGQVIWTKGQPMNPTPKEIQFLVQNPDGSLSAPAQSDAELTGGPTPTPVLSGINPARVLQGSTNVIVTLSGRNFTPNSAVIFTRRDTGVATTFQPNFFSSTQLNVGLPDVFSSQLLTWSVEVANASENSEDLDFKVVPVGTPLTLTLTSIDPPQLPSSITPVDTWIAVNGSGFSATDTQVIADAIPDILDTQFVSPSVIKVLVPANWLTGPRDIKIHAESAQDSDLQSNELDFQVLNTVGIPIETSYPSINAINDGFVPLVPAGSTTPVTANIFGEGFQSGAQLIAIIDGTQYQVPTTVVSGNQAQATLSRDVWGERSFTVSLTLMLSDAPQVANSPRASATVPQSKVSFKENKLKRLWSGDYKLYKSTNGCIGFHNHSVNNIAETATLMVPVDTGIGNGTEAKIDKTPKKIIQQGLIQFNVDNTLVTNSPAPAGEPKEVHDVQGTGKRQDQPLVPLTVVQKDPGNANSSTTIGKLDIQLMPTRVFEVDVHFIEAPQFDPQTHAIKRYANISGLAPKANDTNGLIKILNSLSQKINSIWEPQARVRFHLNPPSTWPEPVDYDQNQNGILDIFDDTGNLLPDIQNPDGTVPITEVSKVAFLTVPPLISGPNGGLVSNRTSNGNALNGHLQIYFVNKFKQKPCANPPCPQTIGFATSIGGRYLFVQDDINPKGLSAHFIHVIAHELGHAIGLNHNSECVHPDQNHHGLCDATKANQFTPSAVTINNDSDFLDTGSLMWYDAGPGGCHIGLPHWVQLNSKYP